MNLYSDYTAAYYICGCLAFVFLRDCARIFVSNILTNVNFFKCGSYST